MTRHDPVISAIEKTLASQKRLADQAMAQLEQDDLHWRPDEESNSIAIILKHVAGNMKSRWTEFLTTDGEKPDRNRDGEFVDDLRSTELFQRWEEGWSLLFRTLDELGPEDMERTVRVGGRPFTVLEALLGQLGHYAQHVGQIVYLAKLRAGDRWETVSIPKRKP